MAAAATAVVALPVDAMFPPEWYDMGMQFEMLAAGIKFPVYANAALEERLDMDLPDSALASGFVYMPHFGNYSMREVHRAAGGNPLAAEDRSRMCLVITQPVEGLSYSRAFSGCPVFEGEDDTEPLAVEAGRLPMGFRDSALRVQGQALAALARLTDQRFEVLGAKLSPLSSNRANIVMYVRFEHACPFERQFYEPLLPQELGAPQQQQRRRGCRGGRGRAPARQQGQAQAQGQQQQDAGAKVRIVPRPIISNAEELVCAQFEIGFAHVDNGLFDHAYKYVQHLIEERLGMHMRHIRLNRAERKLVAVAQFHEDTVPADFDARVEELRKYAKNPTFTPYLATSSLSCSFTYVDNL